MRVDDTSLCCPSPKCLDSVIVQPESGGDLRPKATMLPHPSVCNRDSGLGTWWQRPCLWERPIVFVVSTLPASPAIQRGIVNSNGTNPMQSKLLAAYNTFHSPAPTGLSNLTPHFPPHIACIPARSDLSLIRSTPMHMLLFCSPVPFPGKYLLILRKSA